MLSQTDRETRFTFVSFEFTSNHEGMDIKCEVIFCNTDDTSDACRPQCAWKSINGTCLTLADNNADLAETISDDTNSETNRRHNINSKISWITYDIRLLNFSSVQSIMVCLSLFIVCYLYIYIVFFSDCCIYYLPYTSTCNHYATWWEGYVKNFTSCAVVMLRAYYVLAVFL